MTWQVGTEMFWFLQETHLLHICIKLMFLPLTGRDQEINPKIRPLETHFLNKAHRITEQLLMCVKYRTLPINVFKMFQVLKYA